LLPFRGTLRMIAVTENVLAILIFLFWSEMKKMNLSLETTVLLYG